MMKNSLLFKGKTTIVWLILCLSTILSAQVSGHGHTSTVSSVVLAIAFAKVYLVMHFFMELDNSPKLWRYLFTGWAGTTFLLLWWLQH